MRTRRRIFCIIFALIGILLDSSVLPFTGLNMSYVPRVCAVNIIVIGIILGATQGIIYGAVSGILLDFTVYQPAGLVAVLYTVLGLASGFISHRVKPMLVTVVPTLICLFLGELVMLAFYYFTSGVFPVSHLLPALARIGIGFALVQILYIPCLRILKPSRIGKAR